MIGIGLIGTSLSSGPSSREWFGECCRLIESNTGKRIVPYSMGKPGSYSSWGAANIGNLARLRPDVALIEFLINDSYTGSGISVSESECNHQDMIDALKAANANVTIALMTMNPAIGSKASEHPSLTTYNAMYASLATANSIELIDVYSEWGTPTSGQIPDGLHPTLDALRDVTIPVVASEVAALL